MKETNDEDKTGQPRPVGHSRRDFIVSAATAVASVGAANLPNLQPAQGANAKNSVAIGNGPYPAEGMAAYYDWSPARRSPRQAFGGTKDHRHKVANKRKPQH
jgi:hypothetical protein